MNKYSKIEGYKINMQMLVVFLYISKEQSEKNPIYNSIKNMKYIYG